MSFTKRQSQRDNTFTFEWNDRPLPESEKVETVKIEVSYSKGGMSYFTGNKAPRGIYLNVRETTMERWSHGVSETFSLFGTGPGWGKSQRYLLKELARGNPKELERIAKLYEPMLEELAKYWRAGGADAIAPLVFAVERGAPTKAAKERKAPAEKPAPRQKLLTAEIRKSLPKLYSQEDVADPIARVKFFNPTGAGTWLATEFDGEDTFFGLAHITDTEFGYFSLSELESVRGFAGLGIERDTSFQPKPLSEAARAAGMDWQPRNKEAA